MMHKFFYSILVFLLVIVIPFSGIYAQVESIKTGVILVTAKKVNGKQNSENVRFTISKQFARLDSSSMVYYIVNFDNEKVYTVNNKRKTITINYASTLLDQNLPPLIILKDKTSLKNYLTTSNAHLENFIQEDGKKFEVWKFNIKDNYYSLTIKLPEYFPQKVVTSRKNNKIIAEITELAKISSQDIPENFFNLPMEYKVVDLISK